MNDELASIQSALKRMTEAQRKQSDAGDKALLGALRGVEAAISELLAMRDDADKSDSADAVDAAADRIAKAIAGLRIEAPTVELRPQFTVEAAKPVNVTLPAMQPQINVPAPVVKVMPAPPANAPPRIIRHEVDFAVDNFGLPTGSMTITPIYEE